MQNKLQQAPPLLPQEVQQQGLAVAKSSASFLLIVALYDTTDRYTDIDISDYLNSQLQDPLAGSTASATSRCSAPSTPCASGSIPTSCSNYKLMPRDVRTAIQAQNTQVAAGQIGGQPVAPGQQLNATVTAQSRLQHAPTSSARSSCKTQPDGSQVLLSDVARVELGAENYNVVSRLNGHPAARHRHPAWRPAPTR